MKYEKKSKVIDAVQINKLADADTVIRDCPHIVGVYDARVFTEDPGVNYIRFEGTDADYQVDFHDYIVWNKGGVKVVSKEKFEKKYRQAWPIGFITNTGTLSGGYVYTGASSANSPGVVTGKPH